MKQKKLPRYPPDHLILLKIARKIETSALTWSWPISIKLKHKQDTTTFSVEWEKYPLEEYPLAWSMFDSVGIFAHTIGREFVLDMAIEDHWLNFQNDYKVRIKDYC